MSKFAGKFRRDEDYSDDYKSSRNIYNERKRKKESAEQKRMKRRYREDDYEDDFDNHRYNKYL